MEPVNICCVCLKWSKKFNFLYGKHNFASFPINFCPVCGRKAMEPDNRDLKFFEDKEERCQNLSGSIFAESNIPNKACCDFLKRSDKHVKAIIDAHNESSYVLFPINFCPICGEKREQKDPQ